ncbi:MAG: tRNA modification GTPase MnmE [Firmicutes bacterium ADurb.Bin153]|nr:MAG: tRNA modification GTPase MnmE [Firmicutes bacterium ADurb.Bin153]
MERTDTIAAISTPQGTGGIAIIKISGPDACRILSSCFRPAKRNFPSSPRDLSFGKVQSGDGSFVDEAVALYFEGPKSYTGEDVAEIQCHGGTAAARAVLAEVISAGARQARAGEFTRRAFINGKMSLIKAEATLAMIKARTEKARQMVSGMLEGSSQKRALDLKVGITELLAGIEAGLDWPDETADDQGVAVQASQILKLEEELDSMIEEESKGRLLIDGIKVAIIGRPNMGKSSLLNRILGMERALVSDIPGTTRDTVEETANIDGMPIRFADTAGIGETEDPLVKAGVQRAKKAALASAVVVYVADYPAGITKEDESEISKLSDKPVVVVVNKTDLKKASPARVQKQGEVVYGIPGYSIVEVSARTGEGMEALKRAIAEKALAISEFEVEDGSSSRWIACFGSCRAALSRARAVLEAKSSAELACVELRDALYALGELTGDVMTEDVMDVVFERFCVGK